MYPWRVKITQPLLASPYLFSYRRPSKKYISYLTRIFFRLLLNILNILYIFQVAFEGEKMILVGGSRDRWVVLAESQEFANFHENILSFQVTPGMIDYNQNMAGSWMDEKDACHELFMISKDAFFMKKSRLSPANLEEVGLRWTCLLWTCLLWSCLLWTCLATDFLLFQCRCWKDNFAASTQQHLSTSPKRKYVN